MANAAVEIGEKFLLSKVSDTTDSKIKQNRSEKVKSTSIVSYPIKNSGTQSSMYGLNFTSENNVNTRRELIGFEYRFKKADSLKFGYAARARLERDTKNQMYYQLGLGLQFNAEKRFNLLGLEYFPVRSGPGHILDIYRVQFANYNEFQLTKGLKQIAGLEGNFYTDLQGDFIFSTRTEYALFETNLFRVSPILEGAYGLGTINRRDAYPYWMKNEFTEVADLS
jgi:hypothetical protein